MKEKSGSSTLHVVIDEFEMEDLDKSECEKLNVMFKSVEWEKCSVVLLVQPMIKTRNLVSPDGSRKSYKTDSDAYKTYQFHVQIRV